MILKISRGEFERFWKFEDWGGRFFEGVKIKAIIFPSILNSKRIFIDDFKIPPINIDWMKIEWKIK